MNEKIKNFFACVGGIFSAVLAVLAGIFIGRRSDDKNDSGRVSDLDRQRRNYEGSKQREEQAYNEFRSVIDRITKRYEEEKNQSGDN